MATLSSAPARPVVLTYDDLRTAPDDGRRYEILDGELNVTPSPTTTHQRISRDLLVVLHAYVVKHRLGEVLYAPVDVILDRTTVLEPDLLFVARARSEIISKRGVEGPPDLVVEIASPSTEQIDRGVKQQVYARYGVQHYWRVDPSARSLVELVLSEGSYAVRATHTPAAPARTALFPELAIELAEMFRSPGE